MRESWSKGVYSVPIISGEKFRFLLSFSVLEGVAVITSLTLAIVDALCFLLRCAN
jgi:hypothetical protein